MIYTALDNFYLTEEQIENSPSRKDGIDRDTEATLRVYGTELIQEAGILLKYAQAIMATGQVLFHRFYCKRSMKEFNVRKLAATALWLAAKLEEAPGVSHDAPEVVLRRILVVVDRVCARRETTKVTLLDVHSSEYHSFQEACIKYEREMLKVFGFVTHVEHPHKMMLNYCQILGLEPAKFPGLMQEAWSLLNDSLRTTLCVRFKSHIVACGIIFMAARRKQVPLPEDPPWWELFNVQPALMFEVCREMHQLYARPQAQYIPVYRSMLASKPPTPASPSGHQRPPEGGTGERLGGHNAAGTPAFTPQAAADLERPSSQVDLLLAADAGANREQQPQQTPPANGTQQVAAPSSPPPANTPPGSARKRSRSPDQQQQEQQGALRRPRWDADGASNKGLARGDTQQGGSKGRVGSEQDKRRAQQLSRSRSRDRREGGRKRSRSRSRSRSRDRSRRQRSRSRDRERERHRDRNRDTDRERRERERDRRDRDRRRSRSRSRSRGRQGGHRSSRDARDIARAAPAPQQPPQKQPQASSSRQDKPAKAANGTAATGDTVLPSPPAASSPKAGAGVKLPPPPPDPASSAGSPAKQAAGADAPAGDSAGTGQPPAAGAELEQEQGKQEDAAAAPRKHAPILPPSGPPPARPAGGRGPAGPPGKGPARGT